MFVSYVLVLSPKGYVKEAKFKKEIDCLPVIGEPIVSFYDEVFPFYNFYGLKNDSNEGLLIVDNKLESLSEQEVLQRLKAPLKSYVDMIESTQCIDLKQASGSLPSHLDEVKEALTKAFSMTLPQENYHPVQFDTEEYKKLHNEILMYATIAPAGTYPLLHSMLKGVNTLLALDDYIDFDSTSKYFATYRDVEDEDIADEEKLSYSDASSCLHKLDNYASNLKYSLKLNQNVKPKM